MPVSFHEIKIALKPPRVIPKTVVVAVVDVAEFDVPAVVVAEVVVVARNGRAQTVAPLPQ